MEGPQEVLCHSVGGFHMQALVKLNVWKEMELVNVLGEQEDGRKRRRGFGDEMLNNKVLALNGP